MAEPDTAKNTTGSAGGGRPSPQDRLLLQIVDGGLAGCIFAVPLLMGGRHALGQLVLVSLAGTVAVAWTLRQCLRRKSYWRYSAAELLLAAGVVLLVLQMMPWSESTLTRLAPRTAETLPLWTGQGESGVSMGTWSCVSMTPETTRAALSLFLAYGLLFLVTVQRIGRLEDVERLLRWTAVSAVIMASFGLVQLLTSNGKFFWFYEHPFSNTADAAKGSFTNRNHFAHLLALGIGPLLWWLQTTKREGGRGNGDKKGSLMGRSSFSASPSPFAFDLRSVALGVVLFAGMLSLSRGGMVAMFLAAAICVAVCYRARTLGNRFVLSLGGVAALIATLLLIHGYERVGDRLDDFNSGSIETLDQQSGRRTIWAAVVEAIPDYALLGSGVGSHREVYPMYLENPPATEYTHAENSPLQVLLEAGVVGLTLVVAGIGFCGFWCIGGLRRANSGRMLICVGAISASLAVSVVHALADFVWYVPACMTLVALLAGCACRTWQLAAEGSTKQAQPMSLPKLATAAMVLASAGVGVWMIANRLGPTLAEPHWDRFRIMTLASGDRSQESGGRSQASGGRSQDTDPYSLEMVDRLIAELEPVVRHDPTHARAHLRLAEAYLRRFDLSQQTAVNAMPLAQIRDAALLARRSAGRQAVDRWLSRALGERRQWLDRATEHARRGLTLCPLQGEGYLALAELCFLESPSADGSADVHRNDWAEAAKAAFLAQALKVRPFDGDVLFEAGREAWLAGAPARGLDLWQRSYRSGRKYQKQLINLLAGRVPVGFLIDSFQPDLVAVRLLEQHYRDCGPPDELARLRRHFVRLSLAEAESQETTKAAGTYMEASWTCRQLGDSDQALRCAQEAFRCDPNNYRVRHVLALRLKDHRRFDEAQEHLDWCLRRRPDDAKVKAALREVVRRRLDGEGSRGSGVERPGGVASTDGHSWKDHRLERRR